MAVVIAVILSVSVVPDNFTLIQGASVPGSLYPRFSSSVLYKLWKAVADPRSEDRLRLVSPACDNLAVWPQSFYLSWPILHLLCRSARWQMKQYLQYPPVPSDRRGKQMLL